MRIQHNIAAMNAYRNYNTNTSAVSKNLEKLSSGYKINRAGDDAAGLAISEKMRAQISGLNAASKNVKDGISLVKTAEGAMQEVQDMLNRMVTLSTQSANGTYDNEVDRANLQKEVDQLRAEINRIADSANFNGIKLLDGTQGITTTYQMASPTVQGADEAFEIVADGQLGVASQAGVFSFDMSQLKVVTPGGAGDTETTWTKATYEIDLQNWGTGGSLKISDGTNDLDITYNDGTQEFANLTLDGWDVEYDATSSKLTLTAQNEGKVDSEDGPAALTVTGDVATSTAIASSDVTLTDSVEATDTSSSSSEGTKATYEIDLQNWGTGGSLKISDGTNDLDITYNDGTQEFANLTLDGWDVEYDATSSKLTLTAQNAGALDGENGPAKLTVTGDVATSTAIASSDVTETDGTDPTEDASGDTVKYTLTLGSNTIGIELDKNTTYTGADLAQKIADVLNGKTANAAATGNTDTGASEGEKATYEIDLQNWGTGGSLKISDGTNDLDITYNDGTQEFANLTLDGWDVEYDATGSKLTLTAQNAGALDGEKGPAKLTVTGDVATSTAIASSDVTETDGTDPTETASNSGAFSLGGVSFTANAVSGVLTITMDEAPTQQWDSAQNDNLTLEFHDVPSGTVNNGGEQFKARVDIEPIDTTRQRQYAQATLDLKKLNLKDGASIQIGNTTYTFAIGADSRFKNASNVIDLTDKTMANFSATDDSGIKAAANRLSKVAASNSMFYVGSDTNGKISLTEKEGAVDYTKNNLAGANNNGTAGKPEGKDATVNDWKGLIKTGQASISGSGLTLQIGDTSDSYNQLIVNIGDIHTKALGIDNIDISTQAGAQSAVDTIKNAINTVSSIRGTLGATQNRLEHTANNLSVMAENIQDAESTIRDTDIAEEMMSYTKNNILVQSAQAMLAQANQIPQGVLQLLG